MAGAADPDVICSESLSALRAVEGSLGLFSEVACRLVAESETGWTWSVGLRESIGGAWGPAPDCSVGVLASVGFVGGGVGNSPPCCDFAWVRCCADSTGFRGGCGAGDVVADADNDGGAGDAAAEAEAEDGAAAARPRGTSFGLIEGPVFFLNMELMLDKKRPNVVRYGGRRGGGVVITGCRTVKGANLRNWYSLVN